ncbi:hypothetical protein [Vibrio hepatarius]|uniref:hypothetical protein n=1 Tax=Vibrio hepatarius TaxID=171383 RepID=UPI001C0812B9|nr:hypothetical protein [Vibrio hepatarius]MBU2899274.1 hypothetical protein [Vibrio hepatarius]
MCPVNFNFVGKRKTYQKDFWPNRVSAIAHKPVQESKRTKKLFEKSSKLQVHEHKNKSTQRITNEIDGGTNYAEWIKVPNFSDKILNPIGDSQSMTQQIWQ